MKSDGGKGSVQRSQTREQRAKFEQNWDAAFPKKTPKKAPKRKTK